MCLFNLGNPEARKFVTDFISAKIDEYGLDCYRQDFNMDPQAVVASRRRARPARHERNPPYRGLYAFWDELLARHPHLMIDNCASGGRRSIWKRSAAPRLSGEPTARAMRSPTNATRSD